MVFAVEQTHMSWGQKAWRGGGGGVSVRTLPSFLNPRNRGSERPRAPGQWPHGESEAGGEADGPLFNTYCPDRVKHSLTPGKEGAG